jgi:signal transduction histidine kinase
MNAARNAVTRSWHWCSVHSDATLTALALPLSLIYGVPYGHWGNRGGWQLALTLLAWTALLARTRRPLLVLATVATIDTIHVILAGNTGFVPIATMLAVYTVVDRGPARIAWPAAAAVAIAQYAAAVATRSAHGNDFLYLNWVAVAAIAGQLVQERRRRIAVAAQRAAETAQQQVTAERVRIAGELHDVLAHHITVVNAQAGVAEYLFDSDPAAARQALSGIAANSRAALDELRATLGLLRSEDDETAERTPAPGADQLEQLLRSFAATGLDIAVRVRGDKQPLAGAADLAFYRTIQEGLTNASKHAPGSTVTLDIDWEPTSVQITIENTPGRDRSTGGLVHEGTGHGLLGMRERAKAAHGSVEAEQTSEGGFRVHAVLPTASRDTP